MASRGVGKPSCAGLRGSAGLFDISKGMGVKQSRQSAQIEVAFAKARFAQAASALAPLGCVRAHPAASVGCSFLLGLGLSFLGRRASGIALLSLLLQATELAARLGLLSSRKTREDARP